MLTFSENKAFIHEKKGGDQGIDGKAILVDYNEKDEMIYKDVLFSVKSNLKITPNFLRDFLGTINREKAAFGYFICLYKPNQNIYTEVKKYGRYFNKVFHMEYPIIQIITVEELLEGRRMNIPSTHQKDVLKAAKQKLEYNAEQGDLFTNAADE